MKRIIVSLLIIVSLVIGAELSDLALTLQSQSIEAYTIIETAALRKWSNNADMAVREINKQTDALLEIGIIRQQPDYDEKKLLKAWYHWQPNYTMVVYEYNKTK